MARPRKVQTPGIVADSAPPETPVDTTPVVEVSAPAHDTAQPRWVLTDEGWVLT